MKKTNHSNGPPFLFTPQNAVILTGIYGYLFNDFFIYAHVYYTMPNGFFWNKIAFRTYTSFCLSGVKLTS